MSLTRLALGAATWLIAGANVLAQTTAQPEATTPPTAAAPAASAPSDTAATVDGHAISEQAVESEFQSMVQQRTGGRPVPEDRLATWRASARESIVGELINRYLLNREVERAGVKVDNEKVRAQFEKLVAGYTARFGITREAFSERIQAQEGVTLEEFAVRQIADKTFRDQVAQMQLIEQRYPEEMKVTDEQVAGAYEDSKAARFVQQEEVRASHILVKADANASDEDKAAAKAKIDALLVEAKSPGADFASIAQGHSDCPSKAQGGDLGSFPRKGKMVEPFAAAAFELKEGEISDVVETQFGYHIIKVTERKEARTVPLDEVKAVLRSELEAVAMQELRNRLVEELRSASAIVMNPAPGADAAGGDAAVTPPDGGAQTDGGAKPSGSGSAAGS